MKVIGPRRESDRGERAPGAAPWIDVLLHVTIATMQSHATLVIMARYPAAGSVKTRLARAIGADRACQLYRTFLRDLDERFACKRRTVIWAFHPPESDFPSLVTSGARCVPQIGTDLGDRMHQCFRLLLGEACQRMLLIGADVPHLRDDWLDEAEAALDTADVVLGPTDDGGYYLVALREPHDVFSGIQMSTSRVLADTIAKAETLGLRIRLVPQTFDIDEVEDLTRLRRVLVADGVATRLPHTTALLRSWDC